MKMAKMMKITSIIMRKVNMSMMRVKINKTAMKMNIVMIKEAEGYDSDPTPKESTSEMLDDHADQEDDEEDDNHPRVGNIEPNKREQNDHLYIELVSLSTEDDDPAKKSNQVQENKQAKGEVQEQAKPSSKNPEVTSSENKSELKKKKQEPQILKVIKEKELEEMKQQRNKNMDQVRAAVKKRKQMRIIYHLCIIAILAVGITLGSIFLIPPLMIKCCKISSLA